MDHTCYLTTSDASGERRLFPLQPVRPKPAAGSPWTIAIDPSRTGQTILGLGGIWTDTDAHMIWSMSPTKQEEALRALFDRQSGAGWSFLRLPFGSTDWETTTDYYTYDDVPRGESDWELEHFSIQKDIDRGLFQLARRCKEINPEVQFLGSVWGVPAWMKENRSIMFGRFNPACTEVYARYLRKTIEAYREQGVELYAVTLQNESLTSDDRATPACRFTWRMQADVLLALKKELHRAGLSTKVWVYDHNFDMSHCFVEPMLADNRIRQAIDGVAFHDYGGSPTVMEQLHRTYPEIPFYMTERTIHTVPEMDHLLQQLRCGACSYIQWSTLSDEYGGPHQFLGQPFRYDHPRRAEELGILYHLKEEPDRWFYTPGYGLYGQFTKFLRPGMVRVESTAGHKQWVTSVAFRDPGDGHIALFLVNQTDTAQPVTLLCGSQQMDFLVPALSVTTAVFQPDLAPLPANLKGAFSSPVFEEAPHWDIRPADILLDGEALEGSPILPGCRVENCGTLPTPPNASLFVQFFLDGDCKIARAICACPPLQPGESVTVWANVPYGNDICWKAEGGYHTLLAYAELGGCEPETDTTNNRLGTEFYFAFPSKRE